MNNEKINLKIKLSTNSCFVILIFVILKFRNIGCSIYILSLQILNPTQKTRILVIRDTKKSLKNQPYSSSHCCYFA